MANEFMRLERYSLSLLEAFHTFHSGKNDLKQTEPPAELDIKSSRMPQGEISDMVKKKICSKVHK